MDPRQQLARLVVEATQRGLRLATHVTGRVGRWLDVDDVEQVERLRRAPDGTSRMLNRPDGARIHIRVAGEGPDVVLVHGYALTAASMNLVACDLVDRGHRVITLDWRAHGGSTAPDGEVVTSDLVGDLAAVLEELDVADGVLVGHSTGGYAAMATLVERPEVARRLRGLVLVATLAGQLLDTHPDDRDVLGPRVPLRLADNELLRLLLTGFVDAFGPSTAVAHELLSEFVDADHTALVSLVADLVAVGYYDRLEAIELPTTVLYGEADRTTPGEHARAIVRSLPDATGVGIPEAGHLLNWQHPDRIVAAVESHCAIHAGDDL